MLNQPITFKVAAVAIFISALWGGNSPAIKVALEGLPPFALASVRFFLGTLTVLVWVLVARVPLRLNRDERKLIFTLLLVFVIQIYLLHIGTDFTLAAHSTVIMSASPLFLAVFAHYFLPNDRLSVEKVFGMTLSFVGVVLIFAEGFITSATDFLLGDGLVLLSGLLLGARQVYTKTLTQKIHPARLLFWQSGLSVPIFILLSVIFERETAMRLDVPIALAIIYQGVVIAGLGFIVWTVLLRQFNASRLGVYGFISPISGVIISYFLLGEPISSALIVGVVLVVFGIAVVNLRGALRQS